MNTKRLVVWLNIYAFLFTRIDVYAQSAHDQGTAAGTAANTVIRGMVNTPSATAVVPGYTTTPPEAALAGNASLGADVNAKLAACATTPADPNCQALRNAVLSANTPRPVVSPGDPAVVAARNIARNPSTDLGSLAAYYSGCTTSEVTTPARNETRTCARYVGVGSYSCSNSLSVAVSRSTNCTPGDWFAHAGSGSTGLDVQCLPDRPGNQQHFRVTSSGSPLAFFDVDMATSVVFPQIVAVLGTSYSWVDGSEIQSGVWVADKSCSGSTCSLTAMLADSQRDICTGGSESMTCTTEKPFLEVLSACPAGTLSGDNLQINPCWSGGESGCPPPVFLDKKTCYQPGSPSDIYAQDMSFVFPDIYWRAQSARSVIGWTPNPAYGPIPQMSLTYTRPATSATGADTWSSQCPTLSGPGRCMPASAPQCVDGPSTKIIDGVAVTRDCWEYRTTMSCSDTVTSDQCAPLAATGCTPLSSTCAQTNAVSGACEVYQDQYSCPMPAETVTTASSCPTNVFCLGSNCFNIGYANDPDFGKSMSMLEAAREAGVYLDTDRMQVFKGEDNRCRDRLLKNCCYSDGAGAGMTNQSVFGSGTRLVYDILMNSENREFVMAGMSALITGAGFSGSFTSYGVTIALNGTALPAGSTVLYSSSAVAGEGVVIAFDPWSLVIAIVIYVIMSMMSCNETEGRLALQEGARLCHSVGTYCSSCIRILGHCVSCIEHTTSKCCFNSMLARIVNEQGRAQIGKGWGGSNSPDCSGFTVSQLQSLNFAAMDFTEFYASLVPKALDVTAVQGSNAGRVNNCYFGQGRCN